MTRHAAADEAGDGDELGGCPADPHATDAAEATPPTPRTDAERPIGVADERRRTFRDAAGCTWSVHEVAAGAVPWAHGPRCLLFGSETAIRRVWHYPPEWRTLSDAELETLSWRT